MTDSSRRTGSMSTPTISLQSCRRGLRALAESEEVDSPASVHMGRWCLSAATTPGASPAPMTDPATASLG